MKRKRTKKEEKNEVAIKVSRNVEPKASTSREMKPSFFNLPLHVLENIFGRLDLPEVSKLSVLSHDVMMSCGRILRLEVRRLMQEIDLQMKMLYQELSAMENEANAVRSPLLQCYNVLEVLNVELRMLFTLCRSSLINAEQCFTGGYLLVQYHVILNKVKKRSIHTSRQDTAMILKLIRLSKKFLGDHTHEYLLSTKHGVWIVDLLDLLVDARVSLDVTYDLRVGCCQISAKYELLDIKFIKVPPEVPPEGLYEDRARMILNYLINIVRFNNRLLLKGEWFKRDMEIDMRPRNEPRLEYSLDTRTGGIPRNPREYHRTRHCRERRILSDDHMIISETYREFRETKCNIRGAGFSCEVNLKCPISEAPLFIMESLEKLYSKMDQGKNLEIDSSNHDTSVEILEHLELPQRRTLNVTEFRSIFKEKKVAVYYHSVQNDVLSLEDVSFSIENDSDRQTHLVAKCGNSTDRMESPSDIYFVNMELEVLLPDGKIYKVSFCDANENTHESEIR